MKKLCCVLFLAGSLYFSSFAQEKNPDLLLYKIFTTIKNNDSASFVKLFIDYKQFQNLLIESAEKNKDTADKTMFMQYALKFSEKEYKEQVTDDVGKRFRKFMNTLGSKKIDYTGLNFVSRQYKEQVSKGFDDQMQFSGMIFVKDEKRIIKFLSLQRG